jgi:hypothetical protein
VSAAREDATVSLWPSLRSSFRSHHHRSRQTGQLPRFGASSSRARTGVPRSRSATLSHLFSQGVVSAETFLRDATFRQDLAERLRDRGQVNAARLIPAARPATQDWEIVCAVVGCEHGAGPRSLPFFSQLNFKIALSVSNRLASESLGV